MAGSTWRARAGYTVAALVALLVLVALAGWLFLRGSLAQLDGTRRAPGLTAAVTVARDDYGVPLISGANRLDVAYATGFAHGQDRFFQMDLMRRVAAGELAELFGARALPVDQANRLHRFRSRAETVLARMQPGELAFIDRYVAGVNDGLGALGTRPFEYAATGAAPRPWSRADALLVVYAMFLDLQGGQLPREVARGWLGQHSDAAQRAFLLPDQSEWDTPIDGATVAPSAAPVPAQAPLWWGRPRNELARIASAPVPDLLGSNSWAVAGSRSASGAAIVQDDMHLGLQLPNIWYRVALRFPDASGTPRRLVGLTLPGAPPMLIVGSNGQVAWGFTNSYADFIDLVALGSDAGHPGQLRTPAGWETPRSVSETIRVKGAPDVSLRVQETSIGPVRSIGGATYAVHWIAHDPRAVNMHHWQLETVPTVAAALDVAAGDGIPGQNFIAGDKAGAIGWTVAGVLPQRVGADTTVPLALDGPAPTWQALLAPADFPRVLNPARGQLATSNNRLLQGPAAALIGDGGFDLGARQRQIDDDLLALGGRTGVRQVQDVALDTRAVFMAPWRTRALAVLDAAALEGHPRRRALRQLLQSSWDGHASPASVGYRIARGYMYSLYELLFDGVNGELAALDPKASVAAATSRWPVVIARLLDAQPAGWVPPGYANWRALQLAAIDRVIDTMGNEGRELSSASWGQRNTAAIAHPLASVSPLLARWLAAPADPLPGDANMPRVAGPKFGQSERMTVSPGREEEGLFNMPGGQSGHPLSPYFLAGHAEWVRGQALPLLPGAARHTLTLQP